MEVEAAKNNLPWHRRQTIHLFSTSSHISFFWSCCTYFAADCQAPAIVLESTTQTRSSIFITFSSRNGSMSQTYFWSCLFCFFFSNYYYYPLILRSMRFCFVLFRFVNRLPKARQCGGSFPFLLPIFSRCWGIHLGLVLRQGLFGFFHLSDIANTSY